MPEAVQINSSFSDVISNKGFLNLWINQILIQLSYNSLNFALIVWVFRLTDSTTAVSALLFAVYLPAVIFGLFAGVLVDVTDRKKVIMVIDLLLSLCFFSLIFLKGSFLSVLGIAFLVNTLAQFYIPAESSAIPLLVRKDQLLIANSLFSTTLFASFLTGFGLSGPLLHYFGIDMVFIFGYILLICGFFLSFFIPSINSKTDSAGKKLLAAIRVKNYGASLQVGISEVKETLNLIKGKIEVLASLFLLSSIQVAIGILGVLVPSFFEKTLQINATDASYILIIPLGVGMVVGGILIGKFGYKYPKRKIVSTAILIAGLLLFAVGVAPLISPVIKYFPKPRPLPFFYQPPLATILTIGSFLLGMAMVSVVVPSQTVLQQNTPEEGRGKVFAILGVLMSGMTLVPILLTGILADLFGPLPIFIAVGGTIALLGFLAIRPNFYFDKDNLPFKVREFLGLGHWEKES